MTLLIYLALLLLGVSCFLLHYLAHWRITLRLRQQHPARWAIIQPPGQRLRWATRWMRMTMVLKTAVPPLHQLLNDPVIRRWQRIWIWTPRLAWIFWLAALAIRWLDG